MKKSIALFTVLIIGWGCSKSNFGPDELIVHLNNASVGELEELVIWDKDLGDMKIGETKTLYLNEIIVQHSIIVAPYDGIIDGERLGQINGWCGTGMERVTKGEYLWTCRR